MKSFYLLITLMLTVGVAFGDGTDEPVIAFDGDTLIPFSNSDEDNSFVGSIRSVQGECDATAEVIEGSNWLKIEGATLKRYHLNSGESAQVNYTIDRYRIGANTGFATVRFSTSVQALDIRYVIQSGTRGGGYAIYSTDFENMEDGSILGQPCWKAAGAVNDCLVMEDPDEPENRCLKIGQAQALHTIVSFPDDAYKTYDVKISGRIKYPSEATKSVVTFGTDLNAPDRYGEYSLRHTNSGIQFTADNCEDVNIENYARYDKWFTFSYSFNTDPENPVLRF
ncbi:hypothetical protein IKZ80_04415, partial [bacterium]|nr:hypothetical protein [bacterium]